MVYMAYEPGEDSFLLQKFVKKYAKAGERVLDMGTGSGIQALTALKNGCNVLATDIDLECVEHVKGLIAEKGLKGIRVVQSDLFENVHGKFDLIVFNPPYLPEDKKVKDTALDGGRKGYELLVRFLRDAKEYLNKNGKILLVCSSLNRGIEQIFERLGYKYKLLGSEKFFFEEIFVYVLW